MGPVFRPSAVAQVGLVGCSVRPQKARDTRELLGKEPQMCVYVSVVPFPREWVTRARKIARDITRKCCLIWKCYSEALEKLPFI